MSRTSRKCCSRLPPDSCPTSRRWPAARCCRGRRRFLAIMDGRSITTIRGPITAVAMSATGTACPMPVASTGIASARVRATYRTMNVARAPQNTKASRKAPASADTITADLVAVLVAVTDGEPKIMTIANASALPSGPFEFAHRSLQSGLRAWVEKQTGHPLGYVEQLYTFADPGRTGDAKAPHSVSISYLGLTREDQVGEDFEAHWSGWYDYFPWEDHRAGPPGLIAKMLTPRLRAWAKSASSAPLQRERWQRAAITFGLDDRAWNEELILQRYELLYEAALIPEAVRDKGGAAPVIPGRAMTSDHRRILATGI